MPIRQTAPTTRRRKHREVDLEHRLRLARGLGVSTTQLASAMREVGCDAGRLVRHLSRRRAGPLHGRHGAD